VTRTLPRHDATSMNLFVGSCFEPSAPAADHWRAAYEQACAPFGDESFNQFWLGDQVYIDAPWAAGMKPLDAREWMAGKYLEAWEIGSETNPDARFGHSLRRLLGLTRRVIPVGAPHRPHPAVEGAWGAAAGEGYSIFQTTNDPDEFGRDVTPKILQLLHFANHRILIADSRWGRTVLRRGKKASLMPECDLDCLVEQLNTDELVVLMISKPLIGYPPKGESRISLEAGAENYQRQYPDSAKPCSLAGNGGVPPSSSLVMCTSTPFPAAPTGMCSRW
jgi:hypothetical protein